MGTSPDELRTDIERTRAALADDVDRLADHASPKRIAQRRTARARQGLRNIKERVMGTPTPYSPTGHSGGVTQAVSNATDSAAQAAGDAFATANQAVSHAAGQAAETVQQAAVQTGQAVRTAPEQAIRQTQGNPLAAGVIAFGAGLLAAALMPTSDTERQAVREAVQHTDGVPEPIKQAAQDSAQAITGQAKQSAADATEHLKQAATGAAQTTAQHAREEGQQVADQARESGGTIADHTHNPTT